MTLFSSASPWKHPTLAQFQLDAVEEILELLAGRGGVLLADGAGLGKSWIAAAVARTWEDRGGSCEIVVPASLLDQWNELAAAFGLAASVVSHDADHATALVREGRLVIVDEAHRFRNPRTRRYRSLATRSRASAVLLVTATPICNSPDDLRALLGLIVADDGLADRGVASLDEAFRDRNDARIRTVLDELAIARDRGVLPESLRFATAQRETIVYRASGEHGRELGEALGRMRFPLVDPIAAGMLHAFLWRRLESSVAALRGTLDRLRKLHARALECATRGVALNRASYRGAFGDPDAPVFQDVLFPELWGAQGVRLDIAEIRNELATIEEALRVVRIRLAVDPKLAVVSQIVERFRGRRGLVFTQSRDSARALWSELRLRSRCAIVTGTGCRDAAGCAISMDRAFGLLTHGAVDVVVATDVGCEGLNLQAADWVVHADLPWSPAKLEQRLGRVSRIGQRATHIDEVVTLAEGSPVAIALGRKSDAGRRFSPCREDASFGRAPLRLDGPRVVNCEEPNCIVELLERRASRWSAALRRLGAEGEAGSRREGRALARELLSGSVQPSAAGRDDIECGVAAWVETVRARELQPPRIDGASPHYRLLETAAAAGALTHELVAVLSRRYRAGLELLIADTLRGSVDTAALATLVRIINAEAGSSTAYDARLSGFIVTRAWLRSSARLRRGCRRRAGNTRSSD